MFKFRQAICVCTLAVAATCSSALYAQSATPTQVIHTTGLVGLAEAQTARLNALNPEPKGGASCSGVISFIAGDGTVLKTETVTVPAGTGDGIQLDSVLDLALPVGVRREIRGTITQAAVPSTSSSTTAVHAACRLIGTLEIFNTLDGHTLVTLGTVHRIPPEPAATSTATPGS